MATGRPVSLLKEADRLKETWPDEPDRITENHVDALLQWCVEKGSSDISIQSDKPVYNELGGTLYPATYRPLDASEMAAFLTRLYGAEAQAQLASGRDLDLSYEIRPDRIKRIRFRVNITAILSRGRDGAQITMRTLPEEPMKFSDLGVEKEIIENWAPRQGLVLVTGPTGSGKSTLLSAGIRYLLERPEGCGKVLTYEAPIEFSYDKIQSPRSLISQTEIPRHLPDFAAGVRNALRRKPEIILVGEARDRETIAAAIEAGQTGHLVYATAHTMGVASTIRRMISSFEPEERGERAYALMETLRLIVTQALVKKKGGGRVGLREFLFFDDEIREKLLGMHHDKWAIEVQRFVEMRGRSIGKAALAAFEKDEISRNDYLMLTQGNG